MTLTRKRFATMLSLLLAVCCVLLLTQNMARAADVGYSQELLRGCDQYGNTNTETSFGALAADAARAWSGADVALLPSEDFGTNLAAGPVTEEALANCLQRNSELAVVEMTPAQLYEHLEIGFSHVVVTAQDTIDPEASYFAGYLQMSGLRVVYDAAAPVGSGSTSWNWRTERRWTRRIIPPGTGWYPQRNYCWAPMAIPLFRKRSWSWWGQSWRR